MLTLAPVAQAAKEEEARRRKLEAARLLAEEEANAPKTVKSAPKAGVKKAAPPPKVAPPSARIPDFNLNALPDADDTLTASGIDNALDMLTLVNEKTDKAAVGSKAAKIETHPERRFKAAFEAYKEAEMPQIRRDFPGLRLQQYHDRLYKDFQKSPDNPFNQVSMDYNSTKDEKVEALKQLRADTEARLRGGQ